MDAEFFVDAFLFDTWVGAESCVHGTGGGSVRDGESSVRCEFSFKAGPGASFSVLSCGMFYGVEQMVSYDS